MANTFFLIFVVFLSTAKLAEAICCDKIKLQVEKKIEANKTLCAAGNTLPPNCCKDIADEVEKHVAAYETLCSNGTSDTSKPCGSPKALGMQSGKISDGSITASSVYGGSSDFRPIHGRLNTNTGYCSWLTSDRGQSSSWIQVDLGKLTTVTGIATQGRCNADQWVKSYSITYSTDAKKWTYHQESGNKVFQANKDKTSVVKHSFTSPIHARYVRVWPKSWQSHPSLRVEFYGCSQ